jgi:hypothetical protein
MIPKSPVRNRGYYVCLEESAWFGNLYLRQTGDWNSDSAVTEFLDNATYWPTEVEAEDAYKAWLEASTSKVAEEHRKQRQQEQQIAGAVTTSRCGSNQQG